MNLTALLLLLLAGACRVNCFSKLSSTMLDRFAITTRRIVAAVVVASLSVQTPGVHAITEGAPPKMAYFNGDDMDHNTDQAKGIYDESDAIHEKIKGTAARWNKMMGKVISLEISLHSLI